MTPKLRLSTLSQRTPNKGIYLFAGNWGEHAILQQWADAFNAFAAADYRQASEPPPPINAWISETWIMVTEWQAITEIMPAAGLQTLSEEAYQVSVEERSSAHHEWACGRRRRCSAKRRAYTESHDLAPILTPFWQIVCCAVALRT